MRKSNRSRDAKTKPVRKKLSASVSENGRNFSVLFEGTSWAEKVHIDAEPYVGLLERRCDYAIKICCGRTGQAFFFVELKGDDVVKAAEQLAYTIRQRNAYRHQLDYSTFARRHACIVASHGMRPAIATRYQKYKRLIEELGFESVKCRVRQLTAIVSSEGMVSYK